MIMIQRLFPILPEGFVAAPKVYLGTDHEIDVVALETPGVKYIPRAPHTNGTATLTLPSPTLTLEADLLEQDEYEVRVYDERYERRLVAAIEIVSPSNKDRPESRRDFTAKVIGLLQKDVSVSIVDLVTIRQFNLYAELLERIHKEDPAIGAEPRVNAH